MSRDDATGAAIAAFEHERGRLRAIALRMLGTPADADDALQEVWLRARRADAASIANPAGWLTTATARVCLDVLRRRSRRATTRPCGTAREGRSPWPVDGGARVADAVPGPEDEAVLAESVGVALLVVLDRLSPAQRVAFVLHDLFAVPFEDVATVLGRSPDAAKKLASRARSRVRGARAARTVPTEHFAVIHAFLRAARGGDLDTLLALLAPDVVRRADRAAVGDAVPLVVRGAADVANESAAFADRARQAQVALVDGRPGIVVAPGGRLASVLVMAVVDDRVAAYDVIAAPDRLAAVEIHVPTWLDEAGDLLEPTRVRTRQSCVAD